MGRFCRCLGKVATCFCFSSSKKKTNSDSDDSNIDDKITSPPPNSGCSCSNHGTVADARLYHNAPNTTSATNNNSSDIPVIARPVYPSIHLSEGYSTSRHTGEDINVECVSGARKETTLIKWKVQDFLALCELKELLRNETCVFTAGYTLNKPTRWCFNLQRMKNEDNIGLFLKRIPCLPLKDIVGLGSSSGVDGKRAVASDNQENDNGTMALVSSLSSGYSHDDDSDNSVYIHYECIIKRSGHGDTWIHKRTCIPNFNIGQRLGFRKLFTMEELKTADELLKPKVPPLLGEDNTLHIDIKFTIHMKSIERSNLEKEMMQSFSLDCARRRHLELLQNEMKYLLSSGLNADLMLITEADSLSTEKIFLVHKGILSARSPVFAAMLRESAGMIESSAKVIRINDVTAKAMHNVLTYIYSGATDDEDFNWRNIKEVQEIIYAADKYSVIGLRNFCDQMMFCGCDFHNAMQLLYIAQMHCLNVAVREISLYIKMNANEIFGDGESF